MTEPDSNTEVQEPAPYDGPTAPSQGVSVVPSPGAVSDPDPESEPESEPEQTDNSERPEDGEQDVSQNSVS